jgi:hypothetical protein
VTVPSTERRDPTAPRTTAGVRATRACYRKSRGALAELYGRRPSIAKSGASVAVTPPEERPQVRILPGALMAGVGRR